VTSGWAWAGQTALGGLIAVGANWVQQWRQAVQAGRERDDSRSRSAAETTLELLLQLQKELLHDWYGNQYHENTYESIERYAHNVRYSILLVSDPAVRSRIEAVADVVSSFDFATPAGEPAEQAKYRWALSAAQEGISILASFLRSERLPEKSPEFATQETETVERHARLPRSGA
jgi:hypothetical protein